MPTISLSSPALSVNELAIYMAGVENVSVVAVGSAAATALGIAGTANAWDYTFGTAFLAGAVAPKSFSLVATGGNGNPGVEQYLLNYVLPTKLSLKVADGLTTASIDAFGQTLAKNTTVLADTLPTDVVNMAGRLWKAYYYTSAANFQADVTTAASTAAISGGSAFSYIEDWGLDLETPNKPLAYLAGTVSFTGHSSLANALNGSVSLTVSGGTDAIAQIFDAFNAATPTYWRFNWTDGSRIVDFLACLIFTDCQPLASDKDGVTNVTASGTMVYDTTAASAGRIRVISDTLSVLP
jgi:hypothetical protein